MIRRILWKKGMKLTDSVLTSSDDCSAGLVADAFALASAGRSGLIPSPKPFSLSLNVDKGAVEIESMQCLAVTRSGEILDIEFDTRFTNPYDTRIPIPHAGAAEEYFVAVKACPGKWKEIGEGYSTPVYAFSLIPPDSPVPADALPVARIVNNEEYGWNIDEADFVPPCLYVSSHEKYVEQLIRFDKILRSLDMKLRDHVHTDGRNVIRIFWPEVRSLMIRTDKEREMMTPMQLFGCVQQCVGAFTCGCELDENFNLSGKEVFENYTLAAYDYKNVYRKIREGLEMCEAISLKIDSFQEAAPRMEPVPPKKRRWSGKEI